MLTNMSSHDLAVVRVGVRQNVLNEIVAILIASNINQGDARTIDSAFAYTVKISAQELGASYLEALLDHL